MSRRTEGRGPNLTDALRTALAELLDTSSDEIVLRVDAPGIEDVAGRVALDLEVVPTPDDAGDGRTAPDDDASDETASEASAGSPVEAAGDDEGRDEGRDEGGLTPEQLEEEADAAADFLEGLLDALDLPGDIRIRTSDDHAEVEVVEIGSGALIGRRGQTLEAIQELVRCALQREFQRRSRVKVDAEGYRSRRLEKLLEKTEDAIDEVLDTGEAVRLEPMDVFERKSVHQVVAGVDGVSSRSQGREPARRVIIERD
jgi:spoIIIJ-associated protein